MTHETLGLVEASHVDPELGFLVHLADTTGVTVGLALTTSTGLIGGRLVGVARHFEGLATQMSRIPGQETLGEAVLGMFRLRAAIQADEHAKRGLPDHGAVPSGFIHLEDATLVGPSGHERWLGWWRGRLSEVAGWTFTP